MSYWDLEPVFQQEIMAAATAGINDGFSLKDPIIKEGRNILTQTYLCFYQQGLRAAIPMPGIEPDREPEGEK